MTQESHRVTDICAESHSYKHTNPCTYHFADLQPNSIANYSFANSSAHNPCTLACANNSNTNNTNTNSPTDDTIAVIHAHHCRANDACTNSNTEHTGTD